MGEAAGAAKPELHAVWDGYLLSKVGEEEWRVLKVEFGEGGEARAEAAHTVRRGRCDCKGFEHRLDCRHVKMVQHRGDPVDRATARQAVSRLMERLEEWPEIDRLVLGGYETEGDDDNRVRRAIIRARGRPVEVGGVAYRVIVGLVKPGVLVEVRIEER